MTQGSNPGFDPGRAAGASRGPESTPLRVAKYVAIHTLTLLLAVVLGAYATILIANFGGYMDRIVSAEIDEALGSMIKQGWLSGLTEEERQPIIEQTRTEMVQARGLNDPFILRTFRWLWRGLTLDLGQARRVPMQSYKGGDIRVILTGHLPRTLLLFGTGNLLSFFLSISFALSLTRKYGGWLDRFLATLAPISSVPAWIHGVILILIFAAQLHILPFGGMFDAFPPGNPFGYVLMVGRHMILPVGAIFLSIFFKSVYSWRMFFLLNASEDYVEMARAKGLRVSDVERRYILRPTLPYVITSFTMTVLMIWQEAIALEILFDWPGLGNLFITAVRIRDHAMLVAIVVLFGYMLAVSVFVLDILYAFLDPRVKVESGGIRESGRSGFGWRDLRGYLVGCIKSFRQFSAPRFGWQAWRKASVQFWFSLKETLDRQRAVWREVLQSRSAIAGLCMIAVLVLLAGYGAIAIPRQEVIRLWHEDGTYGSAWYQNPRNARPIWVNLFRGEKLPPTMIQHSQDETVSKTRVESAVNSDEIAIVFDLAYEYGTFPQDMVLILIPRYEEKVPYVRLSWRTPDGRELSLAKFSVPSMYTYSLSRDKEFARKVLPLRPEQAIFADPQTILTDPVPLKGQYRLTVKVLTFEPGVDMDVELVLRGQVHGLAGTDHRRRDLGIALLWGTSVALTFGLIGAIGSTLISVFISAVSVWFGGWVDQLVQRLTEVNLIIPTLPAAIMVYVMYSKSVWVLLGVIVLLTIFGTSVKNYRALFLQVKEQPYIEAARAYGVGNWRIILSYMMPRIYPLLVPEIVTLVPTYVFLETTLAFLGLSDPYVPTWGGIIYDALTNGVYRGSYYWLLEPIGLVLLTGLAFTLVGSSLDAVLNPRLRVR